MSGDGEARAQLKIYGRVQGVFFRANTREQAQQRGLTGWVKNMPDGTVEAILEGPRESVEEVVEWAHQGSPAAEVENVEVDWSEATGEFEEFRVRR